MRTSLSKRIERIIMEALDGTGKDWRLSVEITTVVSAAIKAIEEVATLITNRQARNTVNIKVSKN